MMKNKLDIVCEYFEVNKVELAGLYLLGLIVAGFELADIVIRGI